MNNNKQPKQGNFVKNILMWVILAIVVVVGFNFFFSSNQSSVDKISYSQLMTKLDGNKIENVTMQPSDSLITVTGEYKEPVKVKGTNNFPLLGNSSSEVKNFQAYIIPTDSVVKDIQNAAKSNDVKLSVVQASSSGMWVQILSYIIPMLLFVGIFWLMMGGMGARGGGGGGNPMSFGKSRAKQQDGKTSKVRFADVAGSEEEKQELVEVVDFLKNPKKYHDLGARIPAGVLLEGPPGTGKTLLAKAVAGEAGVPFYSISGSDFVEMFVGTGASRVRDMFKKAQQTAPCIVFIDEIDAVGRQRGAGMGGGNDEREQTLNQLLVEMDGMGENKGIVIIAATNRPDVLDPALLRSGRFDRQITVNLPDKRGRYEILKVHARNKKLAPNANLEGLAKRTPGFSGADLENVLNEGAILAVRDKRKVITMEDLDEAIDRVMMGPAKKSKKYTDREKRLVAFHEAGHAVIGLKLDDADKVEKVTIIPRGEAGGYNLMTPKEEKMMPTKADFMAQITGLMGGRVAEEVMFDEVSAGASNDIQKATKIAKAMVRSWGMSSLGPIQYDDGTGNVFLGRDYGSGSNYSGEIAYEIDKEIRKIINECYDRAKQIIEDNKDLLTLIAETLIEEETITSEQIYNLMNYGKLISPEDEVRAAEAKAKAAEQKLKDLEAGITQEDTAEEVHEDVQDSKEPDIDFDAALKELTKNDYDEHKE